MPKSLILFLSIAVLAFSCSDGDNNQTDPESATDDACDQQNGDSTDPEIPTEEEMDSDRTLSSDSEGSTDDPDVDSDDESKILSDAAYESLVAAGIFVEEGAIFTTSYHEGYNFNFEISEEQARSLLPDNLAPKKIRILESDPEPRYYLSWYMAVVDASAAGMNITRIDLFTYAERDNGELSLYFVASYMDVPQAFREDPAVFAVFKEMFEFFARDSQTGEPAYPHYYAESLSADREKFDLVFGDSSIKSRLCKPISVNERFTLDFISANSQIYRTAIDKNVNYFNQSFINAKVETRDPDCIEVKNLTGFHPMLTDLKSVQFYGSKDKKITWYYEMCTNDVCGSPFK